MESRSPEGTVRGWVGGASLRALGPQTSSRRAADLRHNGDSPASRMLRSSRLSDQAGGSEKVWE